jgi:tetratricopeptide (TPR) repeat protein
MRAARLRLATTGWLVAAWCLTAGCTHAAKSPSANAWQADYDAGKAAYQQGDYTKAQKLFAAAVADAESGGDSDARLARSLNNLAAAYAAQGDYAKAEPLYRQALALLEKVRGPDHADVATCLENYAALLRQTNRPAEAEQLEQRARAIRQKSG